MKKLLFIPLLLLSLTTMAACSPDDDPMSPTEQPSTPEEPGDEGNPDDLKIRLTQMNPILRPGTAICLWFTSPLKDIPGP